MNAPLCLVLVFATCCAGTPADNPDYYDYVNPEKLAEQLNQVDMLYGFGVNGSLGVVKSGKFRPKDSEVWDPHPRYFFRGFNRDFFVRLHQDSDFLSPTIQVMSMWRNFSVLERKPKDCFYTGVVEDDPGSFVTVSLCGGMTGYIHTSNDSYTISPIYPGSQEDYPWHKIVVIPRKTWPNLFDVVGDSNQGSWSRAKRFSKKMRFSRKGVYSIETMIAADKKMVEYHGDGLVDYILTLMAVVSKIYRDPSIGNHFNVAVVNVVMLADTEFSSRHPRSGGVSAVEMMKNFCLWQRSVNDPDDDGPRHHDFAVLLTREDICRTPQDNQCDTLGLAELATMCNPDSSCSVVQDNGLSAAFTIAHEMGHALGMPHDDGLECLKHLPRNSVKRVMARMLEAHTSPWSWSDCSRHFVTDFLESGRAKCLEDIPRRQDFSYRLPLLKQPGEFYSVDKQCELVFSEGAKICPYMPVCGQLWCTAGHDEGCRTRHMPWADGTSCGDKKWCQRGQCVPFDRKVLRQVNGGWGAWERFSECSRTCGGGVMKSVRQCNNPIPANGGSYCTGDRIMYRMCNKNKCPEGSEDFREIQCSKYNNKTIINFHDIPADVKWVAKYGLGGDDRCKLYCRVDKTSSYYLLKDKVNDGTSCDHQSTDKCINGICRHVGCDGELESTATHDMCGECGGDNSSCQLFKQTYNETLYGYRPIIVIPKGAMNVNITQVADKIENNTGNFIVLYDAVTGVNILNSNFVIAVFPRTFNYMGVDITYSGSTELVEVVNITGPVPKNLVLSVLTVGSLIPPNMEIQYTFVFNVSRWEYPNKWSTCDKMCGGKRIKRPICLDANGTGRVPDHFCDFAEKPRTEELNCQSHCALRWEMMNKSECSTHCGMGWRHINFYCLLMQESGSRVVPDKECAHLPKPPTTEECSGPCSKGHWKYGRWGMCSTTCGTGVQSRLYQCVNDNGKPISDTHCEDRNKKANRPCAQQSCPRWGLGSWTPCSVPCGSGERNRPYWCYVENRIVAPDYCFTTQFPIHKEPCRVQNCSSTMEEEWLMQQWNEDNYQNSLREQRRLN